MGIGIGRGHALIALSLLAACSSEQAWEFRNGVELPPGEPDRIVATVHRGADCGFACRPPGELLYCAEVGAGAQGPAPSNLSDGERYCFVGTAFDAAGELFGVGCQVATVGGGPITVTLAPSDDVREDRCRVGGADAGAPGPDAGPGSLTLRVVSAGGGGFLVQNVRTGRGFDVPPGVAFNLTVDPGSTYEIFPRVASGFRFDRFEGGACDVFIPCRVTVNASTTIELFFVPT